MTWCPASGLLAYSALYLLLHLTAYTLLSRRWAAFGSEQGVFFYHLISVVLLSGAVLSIGTVCAEPSAVTVALGVVFLHGIYSVSFLELWSLSQGGYSITILIRVLQRDSIEKNRLLEELAHIGQNKKRDRLSGLCRLRLIRREGDMVGLTAAGRLLSRGFQGLLWLTNPKDTG